MRIKKEIPTKVNWLPEGEEHRAQEMMAHFSKLMKITNPQTGKTDMLQTV